MEKYARIKTIGRGTFGDVLLVQRLSDGKKYAIKRVHLEGDEERDINTEISILKTLDHPNVVKYYESFIRKGKLHIVMEYADGGDLQKRVKEAKTKDVSFSEGEILHWFVQLCMAVRHIHSKKIIHRDIKLQNVLLTSANEVKLGDFGISKLLESTGDFAKTSLGTPYYLSPEICSGKKYNAKSDIWMLGCLLYELCTLKKPFEGDSLHLVMDKILKQPYPPVPSTYSQTISKVLHISLEKNPELRASIDEILSIPAIYEMMNKLQAQPKYQDHKITFLSKVAALPLKKKEIEIHVMQCSPVSKYLHSDESVCIAPKPQFETIKEAETEESPPKTEVKPTIEKRHFREMTINTSFDPPTPGALLRQIKPTVRTATHNNEEYKLSYATARASSNHTTAHARLVQGRTKHFVFSGALLNPELPTSPNRVTLFTSFLREKIGETKFEGARAAIFASANPLKFLEDERGKILEIIGKNNAQYLPIFKYIINVNTGSTPVHNFTQHHLRTQSLLIPETGHRMHAKVPYSTRATQLMPGRGLPPNDPAKVFVSPANSVATGISSPALSPISMPGASTENSSQAKPVT